MSAAAWPQAEIDSVTRMRALAEALPHVALIERVIEAPFDAVWGVAGDLVNGVPRFEHDVGEVEILRSEGDQLTLAAAGPLGLRMHFDAVLRPGWCVMRSWAADIGMAAVPEGDGRTRFAHYEGSRWLGRAGRPLFSRLIGRDLDRLAQLVTPTSEENP